MQCIVELSFQVNQMAENLIFTLFQQLNKILLVNSENKIAYYKLFNLQFKEADYESNIDSTASGYVVKTALQSIHLLFTVLTLPKQDSEECQSPFSNCTVENGQNPSCIKFKDSTQSLKSYEESKIV